MPVKSYIVHLDDNQKEPLFASLSSMDCCEVTLAENKDILLLVTDTNNKIEEEVLQEKLQKLKTIRQLALVSGFDTD